MAETKVWLGRVKALEREISILKRQQTECENEDLPKYKKALKIALEKLENEKTEILSAIQSIDDPEIRAIMELYYLEGHTTIRISIILPYSESTVKRYLKKGVAMVKEWRYTNDR